MEIRLYVDEDAMARSLISGLRARGMDVMTVLDAGMSGRDDVEQLEYSTGQRRVLYTFNVGHFCNLHRKFLAQGNNHAGIIVANRQRYSVGEQIRRLAKLINSKSAEQMLDNLYFL